MHKLEEVEVGQKCVAEGARAAGEEGHPSEKLLKPGELTRSIHF